MIYLTIIFCFLTDSLDNTSGPQPTLLPRDILKVKTISIPKFLLHFFAIILWIIHIQLSGKPPKQLFWFVLSFNRLKHFTKPLDYGYLNSDDYVLLLNLLLPDIIWVHLWQHTILLQDVLQVEPIYSRNSYVSAFEWLEKYYFFYFEEGQLRKVSILIPHCLWDLNWEKGNFKNGRGVHLQKILKFKLPYD